MGPESDTPAVQIFGKSFSVTSWSP